MERYGKDDVEHMTMIAGTKHGGFSIVTVSSKESLWSFLNPYIVMIYPLVNSHGWNQTTSTNWKSIPPR